MKTLLIISLIVTSSASFLTATNAPQMVWTKIFDGGGSDNAQDIVVDGNESVYITGWSSGGSSCDWRAMKYDSQGDIEWNNVHDHADGYDLSNGIALGPSGYVYVFGSITTSDGDRWMMINKYTSDGVLSRSVPFSYEDYSQTGEDISVDEDGNIYVCGIHSTGSESFYRTIKYNSMFEIQWNQTAGVSGHNESRDIALDSDGNVYVTGFSNTSNMYTVKYDTAGNQIWDETFEWRSSSFGQGIATDPEGNIYVAGLVNQDGFDFLTVKYNPTGSVQWFRDYDAGDNEKAYAVTVDPAGYVYVTGTSFTDSGWDLTVIKYDSQGNLAWVYDWDDGEDEEGRGITLDENGCIYVCGSQSDAMEGDDDFLIVKFRQYLSIEGQVQGDNIAGTEVVLAGDNSSTITVGADGDYEFTNLPCDGHYTVTPTLAGRSFSPSSYSYAPLACDREDQDFAAAAGVQEPVIYLSPSLELERIVSGTVTINYTIPEYLLIFLKVYDASGALVDRLINTHQSAGSYRIVWNGEAGIYFLSLETPNSRITRKLVVVN